MRVHLMGPSGRMGQALLHALQGEQDVEITGLSSNHATGESFSAPPIENFSGADVAIDFTHPDALEAHVAWARATKTRLVIGTTGLTGTHLELLEAAAQDVAVLWEGNFSLGATVLTELVRACANALGPAADIEILDIHHRHKRDAPSGTAWKLVDAILSVRPELVIQKGRESANHEGRASLSLGVHSVRAGNLAGDHTVLFAMEGERIELTHRAQSRDVFVWGAISAARWLCQQEKGRFTLKDVLGL